ncbi:SIS domain-containing protein [Agrococcus jejuensis]|uniref:Glutamine--fructose-6-phosphate aminotransferase [isomerizing] n=1 Tax=Agrococcus jejuensis TaxID=399736 RepID=A0A1G8CI91_9MICO|nr:SIS domain-containing protein [Agrococcus jejuensis]SDH45132.1 glucosamine--fructose-6-phosphate aminotransferase (isomerizing) [Agrococcus jejuensis]
MSPLSAYVGTTEAAPMLLGGLARLGDDHDATGIAVWSARGDVAMTRVIGSTVLHPADFRAGDDARIGIAHVGCGTRARARRRDVQPLVDCTERLHVVQDGTISNAASLRAGLLADGHAFLSDDAAEVVAHLLEEALEHAGSVALALAATVPSLDGAWSIVALDGETGEVAASAAGSPLMLGERDDDMLLASHAASLAPHCSSVRLLARGDVVSIATGAVRWLRLGRERAAPPLVAIQPQLRGHDVGDDRHRDEIEDQPRAAARVLEAIGSSVADGSLWRALPLRPLDRVAFVGSGSALHAGRVAAAVLSDLGGVPTRWMRPADVATASLEPGTLLVGLGGSDDSSTLRRAVDAPSARGLQLLVLAHAHHSPLSRVADAALDWLAPPEVGAAAATFVGQAITGVAVALSALVASGRLDRASAAAHAAMLHETPSRLHDAIAGSTREVTALVEELRDHSSFLVVGTGSGLPYAAEGALQLQQLAARWAHHHPASDLLGSRSRVVDASMGAFVVDSGTDDVDDAIAYLVASGARVLRIGGRRADIGVAVRRGRNGRGVPWDATPWGPIEAIVPMQLFARELGRELGVAGPPAG